MGPLHDFQYVLRSLTTPTANLFSVQVRISSPTSEFSARIGTNHSSALENVNNPIACWQVERELHILSNSVSVLAGETCDKECPAGHSVCIDELGLEDLTNTENCYVTKEMATTHTCNSATGKVQLEARISKESV